MNYKLEQNEQYVIIELKENALNESNANTFEEVVRNLFRKGYANMIVDFSTINSIDGHGTSVLRKANKICLSELGLFIIVCKNQEMVEKLDAAKILDLTIMNTTEEAIDAIFLNELENEFKEEDDSEMGSEEDY